MTVLVTGGAGFIGSNFIVDWLENSNQKIVNLDKLTYAGHLENLSSLETNDHYCFVHGDIADESLVLNLLRQHHVTDVIHFAAESHVDRSIDSAEVFFQTNVMGTLKLLQACKEYWMALASEKKCNLNFCMFQQMKFTAL